MQLELLGVKMKNDYYSKPYSEWTYEQLKKELEGLNQSIKHTGYGVKDVMMKDAIECELDWRDEKGYYLHTPKEIKEEEGSENE